MRGEVRKEYQVMEKRTTAEDRSKDEVHGGKRRRRRGGRKRSLEKKRQIDQEVESRGVMRGGDVSLPLLSATDLCVYQFGLHTPASENPCSHSGLHSLDVCFPFTTKTCHSWEFFNLSASAKTQHTHGWIHMTEITPFKRPHVKWETEIPCQNIMVFNVWCDCDRGY